MDFLNSFFQNIKDKLTSPFFGTLTFVIIIHHWEFWYTLFNFDKDCTRPEKLAILRLIANKEFGNHRIFGDVGLALAIMLAGYLVVMGTRTLSLAVEFRFMPWITGKVINKNVVERSVHEEVVRERDEYSEKYEEQRKAVRSLSRDYDDQLSQIEEKNKYINTQQFTITNLQSSNSDLETNLSDEKAAVRSLKNENEALTNDYKITKTSLAQTEKQKEVLQENQTNLINFLLNPEIVDKNPTSIPLEISIKAEQLKASGDWPHFLSYVNFENNGGTIGAETLMRMQELGLANKDQHERISPLGRYLAAYANAVARI